MSRVLIIIISAIAFSSCYRDVEELIYPSNSNCATSAITYNNTVAPLLQSTGCVSCHSGGAASGNIALDSYASVQAVALNGKLFGSINHSAGFSPMPKGGNKMSSCNINKIKAWIDAGSVNN